MTFVRPVFRKALLQLANPIFGADSEIGPEWPAS